MYPVSEAYKTAIRARTRTDRVTGTLTLTDGTVLPLTLGVWFWSALIALSAWTLVHKHG